MIDRHNFERLVDLLVEMKLLKRHPSLAKGSYVLAWAAFYGAVTGYVLEVYESSPEDADDRDVCLIGARVFPQVRVTIPEHLYIRRKDIMEFV